MLSLRVQICPRVQVRILQCPLAVSGLWHGSSLLDLAGQFARPFLSQSAFLGTHTRLRRVEASRGRA